MTPFPLNVPRKLRRLLMPLLVALLGTVLGATGTALLDPFGSPGSSSLPALTGHGSPGQPLNAQHVYDRLAPSVIDITAVLRYEDETAKGTGFVFDGPQGLVLTNNHVVKDATSITATQATTGKTYHVRVVGTDSAADIAVLQLDGPPRLTAAPIGDSGHVQLGDQVLAIGNQAGEGGPPTIAPGIINSLDRTVEASEGRAGFTETLHGMLQTSAQIEPGDSGGPLANAAGQVVGVDTAASTGAGAAGFAIPINTALAVARQITAGQPGPGISFGTGTFLGVLVVVAGARPGPQAQPQPSLTDSAASTAPALLSTGANGPVRAIAALERTDGMPGRGAGPVASDEGPCLDTESQAVMPDRVAPIRSGALVEGVLCDTPAATSGLAPGDIIVRAAGRTVPSPSVLDSIVDGCEPGTELLVTWVDLGGSTRDTLVRVASAPVP
ncbi:MAG TPA: trypsin-like peptidase domain-containing protein [Trebonia sp.]